MRISDWSSDVCSSDLKCEGVDGVAAVIEPPRCLHHHPLIDVQSGHGDLLHDCSRFSGIDEVQPARGWSKPHPAAIGIAGWTFHVIDKEDIRARVSGGRLAVARPADGSMSRVPRLR